MDPHKFHGRDIPHIKLDPNMTIEDLVDVFASSGYNGRQLGEAAKLYAKMIKEDATICLTVSGAMTPVGFGGIIKTLIERGFGLENPILSIPDEFKEFFEFLIWPILILLTLDLVLKYRKINNPKK